MEPRNWKSVFVIKIGTEFRFLRLPSLKDWDVSVRTGYIRSETPIPDEFFEPTVPDANYNSFSFGLGFLCKGQGSFLGFISCKNSLLSAIGLDLAYKNQIYDSRTINNNFRPVVNGIWETILHAGVFNLRLIF